MGELDTDREQFGYNPGYKRGRRVSSLEFQRLYDSDFFESAPG